MAGARAGSRRRARRARLVRGPADGRETFVVFAGRAFRYPIDDQEGRAAAEAYARERGVPEPQIDWP